MSHPDSQPPAFPAPRDPSTQAALDENHLQLLEIGFYISGVLTALRFLWFLVIAIFFAIVGFGTAFAQVPATNATAGPPPAFFFFFMALVFGFIIFLSLLFACLEIYAGICLKNRKHPLLIQVIAALYCISIPWGTALGVCTFMVLNRPSVKVRFL
jgi:uncharacterized membrane protein